MISSREIHHHKGEKEMGLKDSIQCRKLTCAILYIAGKLALW